MNFLNYPPNLNDSGETVQITLTIENGVKKRKFKKRRDMARECVLISLCQQLDFISQNRYELHLYDKKSLTIAVESHVCIYKYSSSPNTYRILNNEKVNNKHKENDKIYPELIV